MNELAQGILIVDFGSQTTLLIARRFRELGVYCEVWPCNDERLQSDPPACLGVVLSGGPASVGVEGSPRVARSLVESGKPVLGICYGMQLIVELFGGRVAPGHVREFGRIGLIQSPESQAIVFQDFPAESVVWMSHSDAVVEHPKEIKIAARSENGAVAAIEIVDRPICAVQFHPEVTHTEHGTAFLRRFAYDLCGADGQWTPENLLESSVEQIRAQVGDAKVICGLSGGVDSAVTAGLISRAIGRNVVCILVDTGLMRHREVENVQEVFEAKFDVELRVVDASKLFLDALQGVTDPEEKRKTIGKLFIDVFEEEAGKLEGVKFLAQGTLYPDVIESVSVRGPASVIKSHHNVGGLPERLPFSLLEPLRALFKDEVRALGKALGIPEEFISRHPFPGPGLAIRVLGEVTPERVEVARAADRIFMDSLREFGLYDKVWQAFAALLPVKTVGVMGDARTYEEVIALRAVTSLDGMTADRALLPMDFLGTVSDRIINQVHGVNRVTYDLSSKPPATIEWE